MPDEHVPSPSSPFEWFFIGFAGIVTFVELGLIWLWDPHALEPDELESSPDEYDASCDPDAD